MLQIGLSDSQLRRELGAVRDPTLRGFSEKIEGYEQARKTEPEAAYGNAAQRQNNANCRPPATGGKPSGRNSAPRNRGEKDRRLALRGKCFRAQFKMIRRQRPSIPDCAASVRLNFHRYVTQLN